MMQGGSLYCFFAACVALISLCATLTEANAADNAVPRRIVSLSVCSDQLLLDLVNRKRIAALSYLSTDPTLSSKAAEARGLPFVNGSAEEVLRLEADLVIAQEYSASATVDLLKRLGLRVLLVPLASDVEGVRKGIRIIASAVGEVERGERLIGEFDRRLAAAQPPDAERPTALAYEVGSLTSGEGTFIGSMLDAAGFSSTISAIAVGPGGRLPLESIVTHPPDLIVMANQPDDFRSVVGDNLRHPAFSAVAAGSRGLPFPMPYWLCPTPTIADAIEKLAHVRRQIVTLRRSP